MIYHLQCNEGYSSLLVIARVCVHLSGLFLLSHSLVVYTFVPFVIYVHYYLV